MGISEREKRIQLEDRQKQQIKCSWLEYSSPQTERVEFQSDEEGREGKRKEKREVNLQKGKNKIAMG